jgi:hypothetical protein
MQDKLQAIRPFLTRHRKILLILVTLAIVLPEITVYFHQPGRGGDIRFYIAAGKDALAGNDLYQDSAPAFGNTWPPFFSFFVIPLALSNDFFGLPVTKEIWYFITFFCLIWAIKLWSEMLLGARPKFLSARYFFTASTAIFS